MCEYETNILAAIPSAPGTVLKNRSSGNVYTITPNDRFFSHRSGEIIAYTSASEHLAQYGSSFIVLA